MVWIFLDALRADHLGCYGYERDTSPAIDGLASRGYLFERAIAQAPATFMSVPSALTSRYASRFYDEAALARDSLATVASVLGEDGYYTAAVSASPIVTAEGQQGVYARGFDHFDDTPGQDGRWLEGSAQAVVDAALAVLENAPDQPLLLLVYVMDPHDPYVSPEPYESYYVPDDVGSPAARNGDINLFKRKQIAGIDVDAAGLRQIFAALAEAEPEAAAEFRRLAALEEPHETPSADDVRRLVGMYDGKIKYADAHVGRLLDALGQRGMRDDTVVVLSSDHGEQLYEHGDFGHGKDLYQETIRVPLIIAPPGGGRERGRIGALVQMVDIVPTILDLCGVEAPADLDGASLTGLMAGGSSGWRDWAISEAPWIHGKAIVTDDWKYVHYWPNHDVIGLLSRWFPDLETEWPEFCAEAKHREPELFDLSSDPAERSSVHAERPDVAEALYRRLLAALPEVELRRLADAEARQVSEETIERLRSLGYVK